MFLILLTRGHRVKPEEKKDLGQGQHRLVQFGCRFQLGWAGLGSHSTDLVRP